MGNIQVVITDITESNTDCIVNSTNSSLKAGGGVSGAIFQKAGHNKLQAACDKIGKCSVGDVVITSGFDLKQKYIIHAVGPKWQGGDHKEAALLASCYMKALTAAEKNGCKSIGFPLISSGTYGYPQKEAWDVAVKTVYTYFKNNPTSSLNVIFTVVNMETFENGKKAIAKYFPETMIQVTGFSIDDFLLALQRILSMTDAANPLAVQIGKNVIENMLALEMSSKKPDVDVIEIMEASVRCFNSLLNHANSFCTYEYEDSFKSKNMRRRLQMILRPHC